MILTCGYFAEDIKPSVVVPRRNTDHGLVPAPEIMLIIGCVAIRTDAVAPYVLYSRQSYLQPVMPNCQIGSYQMVPGAVIRPFHRV